VEDAATQTAIADLISHEPTDRPATLAGAKDVFHKPTVQAIESPSADQAAQVSVMHFHSTSKAASTGIASGIVDEVYILRDLYAEGSPGVPRRRCRQERIEVWDHVCQILDEGGIIGTDHNVFHFGGHTNLFASPKDRPDDRTFGETIALHGKPRCVVINACFSGEMAMAIAAVDPSIVVVCWNSKVESSACKQLTKAFYRALCRGAPRRQDVCPYEDAFDRARRSYGAQKLGQIEVDSVTNCREERNVLSIVRPDSDSQGLAKLYNWQGNPIEARGLFGSSDPEPGPEPEPELPSIHIDDPGAAW
jgi:hypothetical protein